MLFATLPLAGNQQERVGRARDEVLLRIGPAREYLVEPESARRVTAQRSAVRAENACLETAPQGMRRHRPGDAGAQSVRILSPAVQLVYVGDGGEAVADSDSWNRLD